MEICIVISRLHVMTAQNDFSTAMFLFKKMPVKQSKDFAILFLGKTFHIWGI